MVGEFVSQNEFNSFKEETLKKFQEIDHELKEDKDLLNKIDKNVVSIITKLEVSSSAEKTEKSLTEQIVDLKLAPVKEDVKDLKGTKSWIAKLIIGELLGLIIEAVVLFKSMNLN